MSHSLNLKLAGEPLTSAGKVLIMLHGRGGSAADILTLERYLRIDGYALVAPQAENNTWYPYSFMAPLAQNEPWLSSAVNVLEKTVGKLEDEGFQKGQLYFFGFSQGACLSLEFLARNASTYGGAVALIGGLIGQTIDRTNYKGDFNGTPVLLITSNPDFHVPVERVYATANILREMNANVTEKVYENAGHTILKDHIELANQLIFT